MTPHPPPTPGTPEDPRVTAARMFATIFDLYWPRFLQVSAFLVFLTTLVVPSLRDPGIYAAIGGMAAGGTGGQLLRRGRTNGKPS